MKIFLSAIFLFISCFSSAIAPKGSDLVLIFSKTSGYRHASIAEGIKAIKKLGSQNKFEVNATENVGVFHADSLKKYKVVIFLNPTGTNVLNDEQKSAFKQYINNGGGFVGVHAAADFSYEWEWYGKLVGAFFLSHPKIQEATLQVISKKHPSTQHLPVNFKHTDEWYNYKNINDEVTVLMKVDERSYNGGKNGDNHPISWYHNFDGGRAFYTGLGHTKEDYTSDELFLKHLEGGIVYALGRNK